MRFFSSAGGLRVQIQAGGNKVDPHRPEVFMPVDGEYAQFNGGVYDSDRDYHGSLSDEEVVERLRNHPSYGYIGTPPKRPGFTPNLFWSEVDRPESIRAEEELANLRAEVAAYRKMDGPKVVLVEKEKVEKHEGDSGLQRLNRLKSEAKAKGIDIKRDWSADDIERALTTEGVSVND